MPIEPLTLLAVHAHPDDEALFTGGVLARYAAEGIRTVLVTCTDGDLGEGPGHAAAGSDEASTVAMRRCELEESCRLLGVTHLELLGYHDSGMMGWPQNDDPKSFWATPVEDAAARVAAILMEERPQVVMTYNEFGFYGHPDHIQAHRVTLAALELIDYEPTLYFNAIPDSVMVMWRARWEKEEREQKEADAANGIVHELDAIGPEVDPIDMGTPDELIGAVIDVRSATDAKRDALAAHHSQIGESFWMKMSPEEFRAAMGTEWFVRVTNPMGLSGPTDDIFAGYR